MTTGHERRRVAYAGHDFFLSCLRELVKRPNIDVAICWTEGDEGQPARGVIDLASKLGSQIFTGRPTEAAIAAVNDAQIDLFITAAYMYKVPIERLDVKRAVNVHPSYLPDGRGPNPLPHFVDSARDACGISIHELTEQMDQGPLLVQERVRPEPTDGLDEIYLRLLAAAPRVLGDLLDHLEEFFPGHSAEASGSYLPHRQFGTLDAVKCSVSDAVTLHRTFGMYGFRVRLPQQEPFHCSLLSAAPCRHGFDAGQVIVDSTIGMIIAVPDGLIRVDRSRFLPPI